jgi:GT2 family glycosyltransferase
VELDIIVVAHQSAAALEGCLSGLPELYRQRFIVVDNASTDGSAEVARAQGARVLLQSRNLGFGRAANIGARNSRASHLCFLNPDCLPSPRLFDDAIDRMRAEPDLCLSPDLHEPGGLVVPGRQPGYSVAKLLHDVLITNYRPGRLAEALKRAPGFDEARWFWPHGACFFVSRERFLSLGGFDAGYFLYMEDVDFGKRLYQAGGRIVGLNHSLQHQARRGARVSAPYRLWHLNAARVRYAAKHHGRMAASAAAVLGAPGLLAHAAREALSALRFRPSVGRHAGAE